MTKQILAIAVLITITAIGLTTMATFGTMVYADHSIVQANTPGRTSDNNPGILAQDNGGTANQFHPGCCVSFPPDGATHGQAVKNNSPGHVATDNPGQGANSFAPGQLGH